MKRRRSGVVKFPLFMCNLAGSYKEPRFLLLLRSTFPPLVEHNRKEVVNGTFE